jgi:hypothetical protein
MGTGVYPHLPIGTYFLYRFQERKVFVIRPDIGYRFRHQDHPCYFSTFLSLGIHPRAHARGLLLFLISIERKRGKCQEYITNYFFNKQNFNVNILLMIYDIVYI